MIPLQTANIPASAAFLGVTRSLTGRRWEARAVDERLALALAQGRGLPDVLGRALAARGVTPETVDNFLSPTLRTLLPDPSHLKDMDTAAARLAQAITQGERVAVFGDYDVDGATSSALLLRFFRAAGAALTLYIPDRIREGYGPNAAALGHLFESGIRLVVTVDCGITAFTALDAAAACGLEVIVIDHHAAEPRLPPAVAVVNPNRIDETTPHRTLAAVGVTFLTVVAVNRRLRAAGWYTPTRPEPNLMDWLDLVALGTVCDVVPLVGLNRALVAQGLKVMARRGNPGLTALAESAAMKEKPEAYHAGFILGPRVNAGGRVGGSDLGARLLSTDDPLEATALARRLEAHNAERKEVEAAVLEAAIATLEADPPPPTAPLFVVGEGWHPGVVGIVASRLKDRYHRPACVVALEHGIGKASGRSVRGIDLGAAVIAARQAGLLLAGGGHHMAAGFTVAEEAIPALQAFLAAHIADQAAASDGAVLRTPALTFDGALSVGAATPALVSQVLQLAPFGTANSEPRFALADARVARADIVGQGHIRCFLNGADGARLKAIAFRALETDLGRMLLEGRGVPLHLGGHLRLDHWNGQTAVQLVIEDAAVPGLHHGMHGVPAP